MTRKEYVVEVVNQMKENPRAVLAGHGLPAVIIKMIAERPDIMGKLAAFGYSTTGAKKGAKGLKKAGNFKISGYPTFNAFNAKARTDVEEFMAGLTGNDAENFSNDNNILTFIALPDTQSGDAASDIANLKSVAVTFGSSVKKEYKIPGGVYITVMFGDSLITPRDAKIAETKANVNKKIVARKTPAKIKAELIAKAKSKLARLKVTNSKLGIKAATTAAELQQVVQIGKSFGVQNATPKDVITAMKNYTKETKAFLSGLSNDDKKFYKMAMSAKSSNKVKLMHSALAELSPEVVDKVTSIVTGGNLVTADKVLEARRKQIRLKIAEINNKNTELLAKAEAAPTAKLRANINFQIRKNIQVINQLKAKMKVHSDMSITSIKNKAKLLADTNAAIDANRAAGMSIQEALNNAIAGLNVEPQVKQQVKQQVVEQLATGTPLQYAVQQAIQSTPVQAQISDFEEEFETIESNFDFEDEPVVDVFGNLDDETASIASELANSKTTADILKFL